MGGFRDLGDWKDGISLGGYALVDEWGCIVEVISGL